MYVYVYVYIHNTAHQIRDKGSKRVGKTAGVSLAMKFTVNSL